MLRLNEPTHSFGKSIEACLAGMAHYVALRQKISDGTPELLAAGIEYVRNARSETLSDVRPFLGQGTDVVLAGITKAELIRVYTQYFVPEEKIARGIYDAIMSAANEKCPFCGGIGTPRNLDHYLAKTFFPQFAFLPANLIPACRDCNMDGKGDSMMAEAERQPIQPYFDSSIYFNDQWIRAAYEVDANAGIGRIRYFVSAPDAWPEVAKRRAENHFECFDLAKRYSIKAAEHLNTICTQARNMAAYGIGSADIKRILLVPGMERAPFVNHWQRGMYEALLDFV